MDLKGVENIFCDLGVVLIDLNMERCMESFKRLGVMDIASQVGQSFKAGLFFALEEGTITPDEFRNAIRSKSDKTITDDQIDDAWNSFLETIDPRKLMLLKKLRQTYRVFMLSNTNKIHFDYMAVHSFEKEKGFALTDCFDKCYLSYELHLSKPGREIFEAVLRDAGATPENSLFIDDNARNIATAARMGFKVCHYRNIDDFIDVFTSERGAL
ncbi:MAG: HAD family phosphatase [Paludibacteraceae bacterium]|nr:HAD family phosphatase [Paludibacteraceae bacterium]